MINKITFIACLFIAPLTWGQEPERDINQAGLTLNEDVIDPNLQSDDVVFPELPDEVTQQAIIELFSGISPEQIRQVRKLADAALRSESELLQPVDPVSNVIPLNLNPDAKPLVVRTRDGFNTIMSFVDSVGNPWPILWALPGSEAYEEIDNSADTSGSSMHIIVLKAKEKYKVTNYTVQLAGMHDPIVFILENDNQGKTDFKLTYKVPKVGPNTNFEMIGGTAAEGSRRSSKGSRVLDISPDELDRFWVGAPLDAEVLPTSHPRLMQAYFYKNAMIVKTRFELASNYVRSSKGPGGWGVYMLSKPEYELMVVTSNGATLVTVPLDMVQSLTNRLIAEERSKNG